MPSFWSFLQSDSPSKPDFERPTSSKSLNEYASPSPLIRKSSTLVTLSENASRNASSVHAATTTKIVKDKVSRLNFLRRVNFPSHTPTVKTSSPSYNSFLWFKTKRNSDVVPLQEPSSSRRKSSISGLRDQHESTMHSGCLRCSSSVIHSTKHSSTSLNTFLCKLCLNEVPSSQIHELQHCQCRFCSYCLGIYISMKVRDGETTIECPDSTCECRGTLSIEEMDGLVDNEVLKLFLKFKINKEIEQDPYKIWCPKPDCDNVISLKISKFDQSSRSCVCLKCSTVFCISCSNSWHPGKTCSYVTGLTEVPFNDVIKRCPGCKVPIERDAGCAQMQCKKCKHVFCWYCLSSLEDDFLLRHYDRGPCKDKLGHSRASVLWHRAQVVIIFAGFGLLLVVASPLLLFVGPCLLCKSCRSCITDDTDSKSGSRSGDPDYSSGN